MAKKRQIGIQFPLAGLNRQGSYRQQPPYSSTSLLNVRPIGTLEGRERGGSRPGLVESHIDNLGDSVRLLKSMTLAPGDGFTSWSDTFGGLSLSEAWTQASWAEDVPYVLPSSLASTNTDIAEGAAVLDSLPIDSGEAYTVEMYLAPWAGTYAGNYRLYIRLDNTTPDIETDGVVVDLVMDDDTGDYTATLTSILAGVSTETDTATGTLSSPLPGWLSAVVVGAVVSVYWGGTEILSGTVGAQTGLRVGFGMECTIDGGLCLTNVFRVQYYSTGNVNALRTMLVASACGNIYSEGPYGRMTVVASDLTLRDDVPLQAAQSGQKLYIADYGDVAASGTDGSVAGTQLTAVGVADWTALGISIDDMVCVISNPLGTAVAQTYEIDSVAVGAVTLAAAAGTGACSYRIERGPKVYDPILGTLELMIATDGVGQVPSGCPLICRYLDRIILAGAEIAPHVWFASRVSDPLDWDYAQEDSQRAVAGTASEAGVPGEAVTALVPHSDDYLIFGCTTSTWRLAGDPAYGGALNSLSHNAGIISGNAWCLGPTAELIFLSLCGLYALPPGGDKYPIQLSETVLPREFRNIDPSSVTTLLEYDIQDRGVHVFLTPESSNARIHWWFDWDRKTFWPVSLDSDHEPTAACSLQATAIEDSGTILGGRDGTLRRFSGLAETDCGEVYETYALLGPVAMDRDSRVGFVQSIDAAMAAESGDVSWEIRTALTFEGSVTATASDSGTWSEGLNPTDYPSCRGQAFTLKITGTSGRRWSVEDITAVLREAGRRRIE